MNGVVYRFINKDEEIIYVGSAEDLSTRLKAHFEHGHLPDQCYNEVLYVDYAEFKTRTEAYMYEQYEITRLQPYYNTNGKLEESLDLEYFTIVKEPTWKRVYASSNYGYRYNKVYTNFTEENPELDEPNRKYCMEDATLIKRFLEELKQNKEILKDIDYLTKKCPTYMSLIDENELIILSECLPTESIHISCDESICPERVSDTEYDEICIDKTIFKKVSELKQLPIHNYCGIFTYSTGLYEMFFPYCKESTIGFFVPKLCDKSLVVIESKAKELKADMGLIENDNPIETIRQIYYEENKRYFSKQTEK